MFQGIKKTIDYKVQGLTLFIKLVPSFISSLFGTTSNVIVVDFA